MKRSLIIGMGIGNLYKDVLTELGHEIVTVDTDPNKNADFTSVIDAIESKTPFDTAHICTPNFTHEQIAYQVAPYTKIVFVEKPGFQNAECLGRLLNTHRQTRFMMVKNNMWRDNIAELREKVLKSSSVNLHWINKNRVPNPGTWFTTKDYAFGGVSRDLMPHLLSLFIALSPNYQSASVTNKELQQKWKLSELTDSDYGTVNPAGTYDVDDYCRLEYSNDKFSWELLADWRSMAYDDRSIRFNYKDGTHETFELGLCPEDAYKRMIVDAINNINEPMFWLKQYEQDMWIHETVSSL